MNAHFLSQHQFIHQARFNQYPIYTLLASIFRYSCQLLVTIRWQKHCPKGMSIAHLITRLPLTIWAWSVQWAWKLDFVLTQRTWRLRPYGFLPFVLQVMSVQLRNDQSEGKGTWKDITLFLQLHLSTVRSLLYDPQRSDLGHNQSVSAIMIPSINLSPHDLWARLGPAKWKTQRIFI